MNVATVQAEEKSAKPKTTRNWSKNDWREYAKTLERRVRAFMEEREALDGYLSMEFPTDLDRNPVLAAVDLLKWLKAQKLAEKSEIDKIANALELCPECVDVFKRYSEQHRRDLRSTIRWAAGQLLHHWPHWRGCPPRGG